MDTADLFRQALGSVNRARDAKSLHARESSHESEDNSPRIAHTLTACCRCRQMELSQLVEEEGNSPDSEDIVRPGGLIRLNDDDETPRFLGPSSGIAMTRIVMEEAKKYTDTRSIRELVPEVRQRRTPAQSPDTVSERKKSYPMISAVPAPTLPSRLVTDKLVEVFSQKAQYMLPTLHEPTFAKNLQEVYDGDNDPYKNFVLRMVLAISMQKLDLQYAGLADSYYLAAMGYIEDVIRAKDIKTLQCLVLIAQYSMLTPTRTAIYYIVGLATRLCQQLGLAEEKTITQGVSIGLVDPLQLDMRRRLAWIVLSMELGLAQSMGRPNAFATGRDHLDIQFFQTVDDEYITSNGVLPGPMSDKKRLAIHFFRMRLLQAEIRRTLYLRKRTEPKNEEHPWYAQMLQKLGDWLEASPEKPPWSKTWFNGRYNTMIIFLFRPSPQVPQPSYHSAIMCYDAASSNIRTQSDQIKTAMIDLTWPFLLSLFMAINTVLWSISYSEVRALHTKEELEEHISLALDIVARSRERWPGTQATSELYMTLTKACLKSYELGDNSLSSFSATSPSLTDANSPSASEHSSATSTSLPQSQHNAQLNNAYQSPHDSDTSSTKCQSRYLHMTTTIRYLHCNRPFGPIQSLIYTTTATTILSYALDTCLKYTAASDATSSAAATNAAVDNLEAGLRSGSLSQEQQTELMHSLETEGLTEINNFMNPVPQYEHPIKYEQ
ncbi:fungal specific transcription factor domain-containing protein [Botrytis cinerea]